MTKHLAPYWQEQYQSTGEPPQWPVPAALLSAVEVVYRDQMAREYASRPADEIAAAYAYYTISGQRILWNWIKDAVLHGQTFAGDGIELGAGSALLSSVVATESEVRSILAVEVCREMCRLIMPVIARGVLGERASAVVPIHGSFDELLIPDGTLDFALEIGSLHHSGDLSRTFAEVNRVLKPGGYFLCLDRVHKNSLGDDEVQEMLAIEYSSAHLQRLGYPEGARLTRRENGEHEYRVREWEAAYVAAGFRCVRMVQLQPRSSKYHLAMAVLACLPRSARHWPLPKRVTRKLHAVQLSPLTHLRLARAQTQAVPDQELQSVMHSPPGVKMRPTIFLLKKNG